MGVHTTTTLECDQIATHGRIGGVCWKLINELATYPFDGSACGRVVRSNRRPNVANVVLLLDAKEFLGDAHSVSLSTGFWLKPETNMATIPHKTTSKEESGLGDTNYLALLGAYPVVQLGDATLVVKVGGVEFGVPEQELKGDFKLLIIEEVSEWVSEPILGFRDGACELVEFAGRDIELRQIHPCFHVRPFSRTADRNVSIISQNTKKCNSCDM